MRSKSGPLIFAPNHFSNLDHFFMGQATRRKLQFMAKSQLFDGGDPLDRLAESLVSLAVLTTLASVWHPLLAFVAASVASETAALAIRRAVDVWPGGVASEAARQAVTGLYYLLPASDPFGERTAAMLRSMRPADSDWRYLVLSFAYALLAVAFAQVVTTMRLTRRPS